MLATTRMNPPLANKGKISREENIKLKEYILNKVLWIYWSFITKIDTQIKKGHFEENKLN